MQYITDNFDWIPELNWISNNQKTSSLTTSIQDKTTSIVNTIKNNWTLYIETLLLSIALWTSQWASAGYLDLQDFQKIILEEVIWWEGFNGWSKAMRSVAEVIYTRSVNANKSPTMIVCEPGQFDVIKIKDWLCGVKKKVINKMNDNPDIRKIASNALDTVFSNWDTPLTKWATHFMNPEASWEKSKKWFAKNCYKVARVRKHDFYKCNI